MMKNSSIVVAWFFVIGLAVARQSYNDKKFHFGQESQPEFYKLFLNRGEMRNNLLRTQIPAEYTIPLQEHLMIRKSQRSPSLRLRFGRGGATVAKTGLFTKLIGSSYGYHEN